MSITLIRGSTNYLRALLSYENGVPVTGATVKATIANTYGDPLPGLTDAAFTEVTGNVTYNYQLTIDPALIDVTEGILYTVEVVATFSGSTIRKRDTLGVTE